MSYVPRYILILLFTIVVDYLAGMMITRAAGRRRKLLLCASVAANLGVLMFFKYWAFAAENLNALAQTFGLHYGVPVLSLVLPIGLSFHTFQSMAYTIEVYRGNYPPERHFGILALYVLFFPQLVAGPIERPQNLLPQFRVLHEFNYGRAVSGMRLMLWGFFQKMVVADRLAPLVDRIYSDPVHHSGVELMLGTVLFAFQILCDFSGYSDIAVGCARVMGFTLMTNFRTPYLAQSIRDFWRRWHISLTSWFRDYVYIPLGGSHVGRLRRYGIVLAIFLLSGLWHGANWTFLAWGVLNGIFYVAEDFVEGTSELADPGVIARALFPAIRTLFTFCLICGTWIFFRAQSLGQGWYILSKIVREPTPADLGSLGWTRLAMAAIPIAIFVLISLLRQRASIGALLARRSAWVRWPIYVVSVASVLFLAAPVSREFIYFQF
jgi:D-alanyl-lipoteichoic acid acyltransferase DltB (MBOAT superfamily)